MKKLTSVVSVLAVAVLYSVPAFAAEEKGKAKAESKEVTGEILDMMCYLDHGATGEKHADCAQSCIENGGPVGIKGNDGKVYFVVGDHKPMNKQLAEHAGKTVTLKGKAVTRDGVNLLENAEIVKK
jgi:hypothetical protein